MREKPSCGRCVITFITSYNSYIPVVCPVNCSLLGLLSSGSLYGSKDVPPLCVAPWKLFQDPMWGNPTPHLLPFPSLRDHYSSLPHA